MSGYIVLVCDRVKRQLANGHECLARVESDLALNLLAALGLPRAQAAQVVLSFALFFLELGLLFHVLIV